MNMQPIGTFLQEQCHLSADARIAVGVSGGADSMCLLHQLKQEGFTVLALHLDHGIRAESFEDVEFVQQICREWGIVCRVHRVDVPTLAESSHQSIEEAARIARYKFLFQSAGEWNADAVAVAHHANDQAETVLMHFIRGSGLDGLRGMEYVSLNSEYHQSIPLIRPMLSTWKSEIISYCLDHQIKYLDDPTNVQTGYYRNWLRHHLIPEIETKNPGFQNTLLRTSKVINGQHQIVMNTVDQVFSETLSSEGTGWLGLSSTAFLRSTLPLKREMLRKAIRRLKPSIRDLDLYTIDRICHWSGNASDADSTEIISGMSIFLQMGQFYICLPGIIPPVIGYPQLVSDPKELAIPGKTTLNSNWYMMSEVTKFTPALFDYIRHTETGEAFLDFDLISKPINIRSRLPGDRMRLLGPDPITQKLADIFINHKVPAYARDHYPIIETAGTIVWIPAVQISDDFKVTRGTSRVLHLSLRTVSPIIL